MPDQIGCDDSLGSYIGSIVGTFDELRRVLRPDGTVWLNVGDSYTSGNRRYRLRIARTEHAPCKSGPERPKDSNPRI